MIWEVLLPRHMRTSFFTAELHQWLLRKLCVSAGSSNGPPWATTFETGYWLLWKWRNSYIHDSEFTWPVHDADIIARMALNFVKAETDHLRSR